MFFRFSKFFKGDKVIVPLQARAMNISLAVVQKVNVMYNHTENDFFYSSSEIHKGDCIKIMNVSHIEKAAGKNHFCNGKVMTLQYLLLHISNKKTGKDDYNGYVQINKIRN